MIASADARDTLSDNNLLPSQRSVTTQDKTPNPIPNINHKIDSLENIFLYLLYYFC